MKKVVLCILDGVGIREEVKGNAFKQANMKTFNYLWNNYPHCELEASGEAVGLPHNQMGNSEVGHLNIGAGRVVLQDLLRIDSSIKAETFYSNKELISAIDNCKKNNSNLHIMGMISDGGVHSHIKHLFNLLELCKRENFKRVYIHAFLDGRDTEPLVAKRYVKQLLDKLNEYGFGEIVTIMGRYYAMNRDRNWSLTDMSYKAIVCGEGIEAKSIDDAFEIEYQENLTDEFMKPTIIKKFPITSLDSIIAFNYRSDRMIQLTRALKNPDFNEFDRKFIDPYYVTMTEYETEPYTKDIKIAFPEEPIKNTFGSYISDLGLKQLRITEFEKRFHITFYFSGASNNKFKNEDNIILERSHVFTYDEYPSMRSVDITNELIKNINNYDFIVVNYPNGDALGHTGIFDKVMEGLNALDSSLERIVKETNLDDYILIITADHGNCEYMIDPDGTPNKMHTTNRVPFIIVNKNYKLKNGKLSDIAPTMLEIMGLDVPKEMTGKSLLN